MSLDRRVSVIFLRTEPYREEYFVEISGTLAVWDGIFSDIRVNVVV